MTTPLVTFGPCIDHHFSPFTGYEIGFNIELCSYPNGADYSYCYDDMDDGYFPYTGNPYQLQYIVLDHIDVEGVYTEEEDNDDPGSWGRDDDDSYDDYEADQEVEDIREYLLYDSH
jgi:hypothetical protein